VSVYWSTLKPPYSTTINIKKNSKIFKKEVVVGEKLKIVAGLKKRLQFF
jgi:hypothetical protein